MRLSRAGLLVAIAISIPVVVELRTVLALFGIDLSPAATAAIGAVVIALLIAWRRYPLLAEPNAE